MGSLLYILIRSLELTHIAKPHPDLIRCVSVMARLQAQLGQHAQLAANTQRGGVGQFQVALGTGWGQADRLACVVQTAIDLAL